MTGARHDGPYAEGPRIQMTQAWKDKVEAALAERGHNRAWLAKQLGVRRSKITKLFKKNADGSMHQVATEEVPQICALLDLPAPMVSYPDVPDEKSARLLKLVSEMPEDAKDAVIAMLETVSKRR